MQSESLESYEGTAWQDDSSNNTLLHLSRYSSRLSLKTSSGLNENVQYTVCSIALTNIVPIITEAYSNVLEGQVRLSAPQQLLRRSPDHKIVS